MSGSKRAVFYFIMFLIVAFSVEAAGRGVYFIKKGKFSHLLSHEAASNIRKIVPYEKSGLKAGIKAANGFLVKNGYYTRDPSYGALSGSMAINDLGFRGGDLEKGKRYIRVLCLGGSSTFGYGVEHPYPEMMEEMLNENGKRFEVINGGLEDMNAQHIFNLIRDKDFMDRIRPDILVVNTVWNTIEQYENGLLVESIDNGFLRYIARNSVMAFFFYKGILFLKYGELLGPFQALSLYIDRICVWAINRRVKVILVNEPMVLDEKAFIASPNHPANYARSAALFRRFDDKYKGAVIYAPIDFFDSFDYSDDKKVGAYFMDRGHLNEKGYAVEARAIADNIKGSGI